MLFLKSFFQIEYYEKLANDLILHAILDLVDLFYLKCFPLHKGIKLKKNNKTQQINLSSCLTNKENLLNYHLKFFTLDNHIPFTN